MADFTEGDEAVKRGRARLPYGPNNDPHMPSPPPEPRMSEPTFELRYTNRELYDALVETIHAYQNASHLSARPDKFKDQDSFNEAHRNALKEASVKQEVLEIKIALSLTLATQRAEAAEAERDAALKSLDENWVTHQQIIASRKEADALRKDAAVLNDLLIAAARWQSCTRYWMDRSSFVLDAETRELLRVIDAALAVQPTTGGAR